MPILPPSRSIRIAIERALFWLVLITVLAAPVVLPACGLIEAIDAVFFLLAEVSPR